MSQRQILIETPYADFGDIVSQSLGKEASCDVKVATSVTEAINHIRKSKNLNYALLDMDMGVEKILEQGFRLRNTFPTISLILISKKYPPAEMEDLRPWKFLRKPFIQRELMALVRDANYINHQQPEYIDLNACEVVEDNAPAWYMDEILATKNLVAATSNLVVQEAILVSNTNILAHSGELPREAVEECSRLVRKYWGENGTGELIKPVRLNTTSKDHLLSVTLVAVGIILALSFDAETPFDILRSQTRYLTNVLKNPRLSLPEVHILPKNPETQVVKRPEHPGSLEFYADDFDVSKPASSNPVPALQGNQLGETQEEPASRQVSTELDPYWNPDFGELRVTHPVSTVKEPKVELESPTTWTKSPQPKEENYYTQTAFVIQEDPPVETNSAVNVTGELLRCSFTPTDSSRFDVYYACLLVPRLNTHFLDGDIANYLKEELPKIFMAYGWRLEELIINQSYLQWVVRIPPTIAPAAHIKVIMRESSRIILSNFARLSQNEFLREFWSPGYLLGGGRSLIPQTEIAEFIKFNRRQYYTEGNLNSTPKIDPLDYRY
jgi:REP element-mobilizing transposase RayT/CheY-like chemotaxis protein